MRTSVSAKRLFGWIQRFHSEHSVVETEYAGGRVFFRARDGVVAECMPPFEPLEHEGVCEGCSPEMLFKHVARSRTVGVVLLRLAGFAVGVFDPRGKLTVSKVGSRLVHKRHKKGGSSQKRFARRRENEVREVVDAARAQILRVLLPQLPEVTCVVVGGEKRFSQRVLEASDFDAVRAKIVGRVLEVPTPKRDVLERTPRLYTATQITLHEPTDGLQ